jgi:membrane-bound serine protease (ClpP class)
MRRARILFATAALAIAGASWAARVEGQDPASPVAAFVSLEGSIDGLAERTLEARIRRALERGPRFLVVSISSGGGEVETSRNIAWNLHNLEDVTVVAWIRGRALSGATMVAFGCDAIAMRSDGQLGDVLPIAIDLTGALQPEVAEKMIVPVRKDLRDLAELQGYPGDVAEAMVDPRLELHRLELQDERTGRTRPEWVTREALDGMPFERRARIVSDEVVSRPGQLLVIGPDEAQDMGIARIVADDEATLLRALAAEHGLPPLVAVHEAGLWWEHVVRFLTWWPIKTLLFVIGVVALAMVFASPGHGLPEVVALVCLGTVFFGSYLIGLADHVEALLFVVGAVLLGLELFTPGFGVLGVAGCALIAGSLLLSFQKFVLPRTPVEWDLFRLNLLRTVLAGVGSLVALTLVARFAPRFGPFRRLALEATLPAALEPTAAQELAPVGTSAESVTVLRPVGKVRVGQDVFDAVAEEGWIDAGAPVVVISHRAGQLVVSGRPETRVGGAA